MVRSTRRSVVHSKTKGLKGKILTFPVCFCSMTRIHTKNKVGTSKSIKAVNGLLAGVARGTVPGSLEVQIYHGAGLKAGTPSE
jgi:hypothetical protein